MRREYVKPMIESEEFVANEYVAACWVITCTNNPSCGSILYKPESDSEEPPTSTYVGQEVYVGEIGNGANKDGCMHTDTDYGWPWDDIIDFLQQIGVFQKDTDFHPVTLSDDGWVDHPNASV